MENEVQNEVIEYLQKRIDKLEKENKLYQDTIIHQKETNTKLLNSIREIEHRINSKNKEKALKQIIWGDNPYQE